MKTLLDRFNEKWTPEPFSGCWLWSGARNGKGYGEFRDKNGLKEGAHRVSFSLFKGEIPAGLYVLHHCDTPSCVNPDHLFAGTNSENRNDCIAKGRDANRKGSKNPKSKLTDNDVIAIRQSREKLKVIAAQYGMPWKYMSAIRRRRYWKHIP